MTETIPPSFIQELAQQLLRFAGLCDDALSLTSRESQALNGGDDYNSYEFYQGRKALLLRLDEGLNLLRTWRQAWQRLESSERARHSEVKLLLQTVQDALVRILVLDRENQQALLRRGLVPARQVASFNARPPQYAARVYRSHSS